jgi:acetolactate synthase small subunit
MSIATLHDPADAPPRLRRAISVETHPDAPEALVRVLGVLSRRGCTLARVDYAATDRHRPGRLVIAYDAPAGRTDRTVERLRALVDVLAVEPLGP